MIDILAYITIPRPKYVYSRSIPTELHIPQVFHRPLVDIRRLDKRDMRAQGTMSTRTVDADVDSEMDRSPRRRFIRTIKAFLWFSSIIVPVVGVIASQESHMSKIAGGANDVAGSERVYRREVT